MRGDRIDPKYLLTDSMQLKIKVHINNQNKTTKTIKSEKNDEFHDFHFTTNDCRHKNNARQIRYLPIYFSVIYALLWNMLKLLFVIYLDFHSISKTVW